MWRRSGEVIRTENDQRTELINLRVTCAGLAAAAVTAFGGIVLLVLLPLSEHHAFLALGLVPPAMLVAATIGQAVAERRYGRPSRELQRAVAQRALLIGAPLVAGLTAGLAEYLSDGRPEQALRIGLVVTLGCLIGLSIHLWRLNRRG
jgi:hypothetical protein